MVWAWFHHGSTNFASLEFGHKKFTLIFPGPPFTRGTSFVWATPSDNFFKPPSFVSEPKFSTSMLTRTFVKNPALPFFHSICTLSYCKEMEKSNRGQLLRTPLSKFAVQNLNVVYLLVGMKKVCRKPSSTVHTKENHNAYHS